MHARRRSLAPVSSILRNATVASLSTALFACGSSDGPPGDGPAEPLDVAAMRNIAEASADDMSQFLSRLVQYRSIERPDVPIGGPPPEATLFALREVLDLGDLFGMSPRKHGKSRVGILEYGEGDETVGAVIHLDVVPVADETTWTHGPFSGDIVDGEVWGRGAQDDKGAAASVLWAAKMLIDSGVKYPRKLRLIFGTAEEVEFLRDITPYFEEEGPPDFGIVPDGLYVGNGEAGYMDAAVRFPDGEMGSGRDQLLALQGGEAVNSVPEVGYAAFRSADVGALREELQGAIASVAERVLAETQKEVGLKVQTPLEFAADFPGKSLPAEAELVLSSRGVAFHSSVPQLGRNAIVEVGLAAARLAHLADGPAARAVHFLDEKIALTVDGSLLGFQPPAAGLGTTLSVDLASTTRSGVDLLINTRRRANVESNDLLLQRIEQAAGDGAKIETRGDVLPGYDIPADDPALALLTDSFERVMGEKPPVAPNTAATYVQAAPANLTLYGPVMPGTDDLHFHAVDERVSVSALTRNAVLFADALQEMLLTEETLARPSP